MKILVLATALMAAVAVSAPAEAAKKKKVKRVAMQQATTVSQDSYMVIDGDGEILGRDPDPFIRMMLRKDGSMRHQSGR
jgi:outer membrane lipoprotein-sorting protein